jgi:hypothetical protein
MTNDPSQPDQPTIWNERRDSPWGGPEMPAWQPASGNNASPWAVDPETFAPSDVAGNAIDDVATVRVPTLGNTRRPAPPQAHTDAYLDAQAPATANGHVPPVAPSTSRTRWPAPGDAPPSWVGSDDGASDGSWLGSMLKSPHSTAPAELPPWAWETQTQRDEEDLATLETAKLPVVALPDLPTRKQPATLIELDYADKPTRKLRAPKRRLQLVSSLVTLGLLVFANLVVQVNRRFWDMQSDPLNGLVHVQACESLGRVPDLIFLGSSRTLHGIDPKRVDSVMRRHFSKTMLSCNAADDASTFEQDYYTLKRLIEDGYAPKAIVETLWEYNLAPYAYGSHPVHLEPQAQIPWLADMSDVSTLRGDSQAHLANNGAVIDYVAGKVIPLYGDRNGLHDVAATGLCVIFVRHGCQNPLVHLNKSIASHGWIPLTGRNMVTNPPPGPGCGNTCTPLALQTNGYEVTYLRKLIELAQSHNIVVSLIVTPLTDRQRANYAPVTWKRMLSFWQAIAHQYHVRYYDANALSQFTLSDFFDPMHLDAKGAAKFSDVLAVHVVAPVMATLH